MNNNLEREYFNWMYSKLDPKWKKYFNLCSLMHNTDYFYNIPMDENSYINGINLRYKFGDSMGISQPEIASILDVKPCSFLEMLTALVLRIEESITYDFSTGVNCEKWFYSILENMELLDQVDRNFDADYCSERLFMFMDHQYGPNGEGGMFYVMHPKRDMRVTDVWYQAMWYITEHYINEGE